MTSNYLLMTKSSLEEITQKIDQFLSTLPSDSLGACKEQWTAFVRAYAQNYFLLFFIL